MTVLHFYGTNDQASALQHRFRRRPRSTNHVRHGDLYLLAVAWDQRPVVAGALDTSRFTVDPGLTCVPEAGFVLLTLPAGIVELTAVVTAPTTKPALFNFSSAAFLPLPIASN